ncbi:MAG: hypothetical protein KJ971_07280 [Firmicutes bacterium]|nr:hypothetical protein [Bacillota bacterium]
MNTRGESKLLFALKNTIYIILIAFGTSRLLYYHFLDRDIDNGYLVFLAIMLMSGIVGIFIEIYKARD